MGLSLDQLLLIRQVHLADVAVVRRGRTGRWDRPDADAIVSDDPSSAVGVRVADCAPVLLADRRRGAVGAVHAGWRGTFQEAAAAGVEAMTREFGSEPRDLVAAIGPCLGPCCGEVGPEVVEAFREAGHGEDRVGRWFVTGPSGRPVPRPVASQCRSARSGRARGGQHPRGAAVHEDARRSAAFVSRGRGPGRSNGGSHQSQGVGRGSTGFRKVPQGSARFCSAGFCRVLQGSARFSPQRNHRTGIAQHKCRGRRRRLPPFSGSATVWSPVVLKPHVEHRVVLPIHPRDAALLAEFIPEPIHTLSLRVVRADRPNA